MPGKGRLTIVSRQSVVGPRQSASVVSGLRGTEPEVTSRVGGTVVVEITDTGVGTIIRGDI